MGSMIRYTLVQMLHGTNLQ